MDGGIFGLLGLISAYRGALEYDFRSRFGTGLSVIGQGMSLWEAARLAKILRSDPASALAAAAENWEHPVSREAAILMDIWDLEYAKSGAKKTQRYARPFAAARDDAEKLGNTIGQSPTQVKAILAAYRGKSAQAPV